ncbi:uncharacterized protein LOC127255125 isoform X1 [Andrographis paniculata]|uniref:uncharacterized protein LOC127255125 isoform X1 n=1 Tax=Andrographis paniculata TaxID=175694 RepID=UPI0021E8A242|nr:uncharacterized protein LOC127255125 isoform X1 [Andrographis paniculata]XP_051136471.1 uncharacterized protein LOC127255125 isoform X1 [Andrographis paniculata]
MDRGLTAEAAAHLQDGINLLLSRWTALRMTVENEWGGRDSSQKAQQLGQQLCYLLTQSKEQVYIEDLEDLLEDSILSLNTVIDDGSIEEVAEKLLVMHEECVQGNFDSIEKLKGSSAPSLIYVKQPGNDDEESEDDEVNINRPSDMEVDVPQSNTEATTSGDSGRQATEVVDGWTVVSSRRNRSRRN